MTQIQDVRTRFEEIAIRPDGDIHLDEAALLISAENDPNLDIPYFLECLDNMAKKFESIIHYNVEPAISVTSLTHFIHQGEGFTGDTQSYYDPKNSYLDKVIEHRQGIPITLALIHISLGKRLNIAVHGMNFPGRFLVKYGRNPYTVVDPFSGRVISPENCNNLLKQMGGPKQVVKAHYFDTASNKDILVRILDNLKQIYWKSKSWKKSKACIERQILLKPTNGTYIVQLGVINEMQGRFQNAQHIYTELLHQTSDEALRDVVSKRLLSIQTIPHTKGKGKVIH
ncbi:MAG: transglutaminase family protein [Pseudomonadales bacterium]|nr:transglutaminase family protein [Pseudomonadales bacterium]